MQMGTLGLTPRRKAVEQAWCEPGWQRNLSLVPRDCFGRALIWICHREARNAPWPPTWGGRRDPAGLLRRPAERTPRNDELGRDRAFTPPALSQFRLQKLLESLATSGIPARAISAEFVHVAETTANLTAAEQTGPLE